MKRDIKVEMSVPEYYRKLGDEVLLTDLPKEERKHLKALYYEYALKVEREEQEALKVYKIRNFKRGKK